MNKLIDQITEEAEKPILLEWYPNNVAYQLNAPRNDINKSEHYSKLRQFIITQTEAGIISRQEAVSMIPPLFLDVKPYHDVLDICAAPGSKTTQILEMIHAGPEEPTGLVIANDSDFKRCELLDHQTKRMQSPNIIITNHLAQKFPLKVNNEFKKYDRVLCDVPCTGDGTLRKNVDAWSKWNTIRSVNLHKDQCTIMKRAVRLVKNGGRFVYSTCSLNPYEDECVVAFLLRMYPQIRLVDVSQELPELKRCNGISSWRVYDGENNDITDQKPEFTPELNLKMPYSLFPPTQEEVEKFHLERCMRFLPQLQNTGGFFVAVLEKVGDLENDFEDDVPKRRRWNHPSQGSQSETEKQQQEEKEQKEEKKGKKKGKGKGRRDNANLNSFTETETYEKVKEIITNFYGLNQNGSDDFDFGCLGVKGDGKLTLHYVIRKGMDIVRSNDLKVIGGGLKLFRKHSLNKQSNFRLSNEGLSAVAHLFGEKRKIVITQKDFVEMLLNDAPIDLTPEIMEKTAEMEIGCVIFQIVDDQSLLNMQYFSGWKSKGFSLFISKVDKKALCQNLKIEMKEKTLPQPEEMNPVEKEEDN